MERSRNPGVGYWSSNSQSGPSSSSAVPAPRSGMTSPTPVTTPGLESMMGTPTRERKSLESVDTRSSPAPSEAPSQSKAKPVADEEEVNLEVSYLLYRLYFGKRLMGSICEMSFCSSWRTRR